MKSSVFLILIAIAMIIITNCQYDAKTIPDLPDINVIDISSESNWDYAVLGKNDYYFVKADGSLPEAVLFHSAESNRSYSIFFLKDGYLDKVFVEDYIFSFKNPNGNKIDIGIVFPSGKIEILRDLETDYNWDKFRLKSANSIEEWSDVIRWTGRIVSGVPCGLSVAAAVSTAGAGTPIALWVCGNYLLGLSSDIMQNEFELHNGFTDFADAYGAHLTIASCSGGDAFLECASDLTSRAFNEWADHREEIENRKDDVMLADAALEYGYGDVQVTLTWDNTADLDLHVIDPNGEEIYWDNTKSNSKGELDIDDINGYGPENIYWPSYEAPSGNYQVYIHFFPWNEADYRVYTGNAFYPNSSDYSVLVNAFGITKKFTGSIFFDETIHITNFDQDGLKIANVKSEISTRKTNKQKSIP